MLLAARDCDPLTVIVTSHSLDVLGDVDEARSTESKIPELREKNVAVPTTAAMLKDALDADLIPRDPLTRQHFAFSKVSSPEEETCLVGLYQGLFQLPSPPSLETLQKWQQNDKLAGGIYYSYKSQQARSGYFNWFNKNQHIFSQTYARPEGEWAPETASFELDFKKLGSLTARGKWNHNCG